MSPIVLHIIIFAAGIFGFLISSHIRTKKSRGEPLVCPLKADCMSVIHSEHSKVLGLPVEQLGRFYYAFVVLNQTAMYFVLAGNVWNTLVLIISFIALSFSLYLTIIQLFVIKEKCTWCFGSALLSLVIFLSIFLLQ